MNNYENTISVKASQNQVFDALTIGMSKWWTEMTSIVNRVGDKTTAKFEDGTTWSFEVIKLEQNKLIEFHCYDANHIHPVTTPQMRTEWKNTVLRYEIIAKANSTEIHFTHIGLTPKASCYEICNSGWNHFFGTTFKVYLDKLVE